MRSLAGDRRGELHQLRRARAAPCRRSARPSAGAWRLARQRDGELHALDVAIGQRDAGPVGRRPCRRARGRLAPRRGAAPRIGPTARVLAHAADQGHLHVLGHRHRQERLRDLEGAPDPAPECARGGRPVMSWRRRGGRARVGRKLPADHVEDRGLAGAVRADDGEQLAGARRRSSRCAPPPRRRRTCLDPSTLSRLMPRPLRAPPQGRSAPTSRRRCPGKTSTMAMMLRPSIRRQSR